MVGWFSQASTKPPTRVAPEQALLDLERLRIAGEEPLEAPMSTRPKARS
jgi:hypothetical protein